MKTKLVSLFLVLFHFISFSQSQQQEYSILFYNVENLFDLQNDSVRNDDEFTADGDRHWNKKRLETKLLNISKSLLNITGWEVPVLIGLCEVENRYILNRLIKETPLQSHPFQIIHKDSPDNRGIDVALLFNKDSFYPLFYEFYPLVKPDSTKLNTREILYAKGIIGGMDTLHVFVNHWPSRYSGVMETRGLRNLAALTLKSKVDEVFLNNPSAKIVIMGDFNDQPSDESLEQHLEAKRIGEQINIGSLYNLSYDWRDLGLGTLKYQSQWFVFDQFIVSGVMLDLKGGLFTKPEWATVADDEFLFEEDATHGGRKLNRTYTGYRYNGGFSDHLPIKLKLGVR